MMRTSEARRLYSPMLSSQRGRTAPLVFLASRRLRGFLRSQHSSELTHFDRLVQCCHRPEAFVLRQHLGVSRVVRCITYAPLPKCPWAARRMVVDMGEMIRGFLSAGGQSSAALADSRVKGGRL